LDKVRSRILSENAASHLLYEKRYCSYVVELLPFITQLEEHGILHLLVGPKISQADLIDMASEIVNGIFGI